MMKDDRETGDGGRLKRLFTNTGIYMVGEFSIKLLSAFITPIYTILLLPEEYGVWSLSVMALAGLTYIFNPALHGAVTRFWFDHENTESARRRFQGTVLSFLLLWSTLLVILLNVVGVTLFDLIFVDLPFHPWGDFIVWIAYISTLSVVPKATWIAAERPKTVVGINLLATAVNLLGAIALVIFAHIGVIGLFWAKLASVIIVGFPYISYLRKNVSLAWDNSMLKQALAFSLPLVPHLIAHWILAMSDRLIIERYAGIANVGIYSSAYVFIEGVNMVAMSMNRAWVPLFTRDYGDASQRPFIGRSITYFLTIVTGITLLLVVLSPTIIRIFYAENYAAAANVAPILAMGGLFQGTYYIYVGGLFYFKRTTIIPFITITAGLVNIGLNILLIPIIGLEGAAWATLAGYAVLAFGVRFGCRRVTKLPIEWWRLWKLAVIAVPVVSTTFVIDGILHPGYELLAKLALLLAATGVLFISGFWQPEEIHAIKSKVLVLLHRH